jgi:8-oxo-dGTP diphosphatase
MNYTYDYPRYKITVDVACTRQKADGSGSEMLVIKRLCDPYKGEYALPGGNLNPNETLEQCGVRELREETGIAIEACNLVHVNNYSQLDRNPGERAINIVYRYTLRGNEEIKVGDDAEAFKFVDVKEAEGLAFEGYDVAVRIL